MAVGAALKIGASFVGLDDLARIRNRIRKIGRDLRIRDAATRGAGHDSGGAEIVVVLVVEGMARQTPHRLDGVAGCLMQTSEEKDDAIDPVGRLGS